MSPDQLDGLEELLLLGFEPAEPAVYPSVERVAARAGWSLAVEFALCFWVYYVHACLRRHHHETSLWDAVASASRAHPEALKMMPLGWALTDVFGLRRDELPWSGDLTSGIIRIAWAFTELEDRCGRLIALGAQARHDAWRFVESVCKSPVDRVLAAGVFSALAGDAPPLV
ncbi:MAG TPA: hypothetical protein VFK80_12050 [Limnochordia bacterium]|nr:hypothetical protein [Limnochordia bacterium]